MSKRHEGYDPGVALYEWCRSLKYIIVISASLSTLLWRFCVPCKETEGTFTDLRTSVFGTWQLSELEISIFAEDLEMFIALTERWKLWVDFSLDYASKRSKNNTNFEWFYSSILTRIRQYVFLKILLVIESLRLKLSEFLDTLSCKKM